MGYLYFFYHAIKWFSEAYTQTDPLGGSTDAWLCVCGVIADDCFQLGKVAYNNEDFYHAIKWFSEALRLDEQETIKSSARHVVLDYLSYSVYMVRVTHTRALTQTQFPCSRAVFIADMELGHWVTGSMGHLGHLSRPDHRVTGSSF